MSKKPYYLTTAIAYTSGKPHIGNTYEIVLADAIVRYKRFQGYDVRFQTGTDEHGQKIELKAQEAGITPKEFVDGVSTEIKRIWDLMNTSYDRFIRTTDEAHEKQVQKIFKKLYDKGDIYKGFYEGMYCTPCESFFTPSQLVDGKCPDCGRECQPAKEEAYFLKLSKYQDRLMKHIETHPEFIQPESRKNEMVNNFLKPGLQDLCVSRTSFKWGIPVDFDPAHVIYVWIDALSNYVTGTGFDLDGNHTLVDGENLYEKYWPADLHLIGKDILRFHTIYWPIMLHALGVAPVEHYFIHGYWIGEGGVKMSKSLGNVVDPAEVVRLLGVDALRFYLINNMTLGGDSQISVAMLKQGYKMLANNIGNLQMRVLKMVQKSLEGKVPSPAALNEEDKALVNDIAGRFERIFGQEMSLETVSELAESIVKAGDAVNAYFAANTPWVLAKNPAERARFEAVVYTTLECLRLIGLAMYPLTPATARKIEASLGVEPESFKADFKPFALPEGTEIKVGDPLFPMIEE